MRLLLRFLLGSFVANIASFPLAALTALVFRFPIPFGDYASGPNAIIPALYAVVFYEMLGGFLVQSVLGGIAALIPPPNHERTWIRSAAAAALAAVPGVLILSVLDWMIGPW
jgi:hypothetical protein